MFNMISTNGLNLGWCECLLFLTPLMSPTPAALMFQGSALPPVTTAGVTKDSSPLEAVVSNTSIFCVPPAENPDWGCPIRATDCAAALSRMTNEVCHYGGQSFMFWSRMFRNYAPLYIPWM